MTCHLKKEKLPVKFWAGEVCVQRNTPFSCSSCHPYRPLSCIWQGAASIQIRHERIHMHHHDCTLHGDNQDIQFPSSDTAEGRGGEPFRRGGQKGSQSSRDSGFECTGGPWTQTSWSGRRSKGRPHRSHQGCWKAGTFAAWCRLRTSPIRRMQRWRGEWGASLEGCQSLWGFSLERGIGERGETCAARHRHWSCWAPCVWFEWMMKEKGNNKKKKEWVNVLIWRERKGWVI